MSRTTPSTSVTLWRFEEAVWIAILGIVATVAFVICAVHGLLGDFVSAAAAGSIAQYLRLRYEGLRHTSGSPGSPMILPPGTRVASRAATVILSLAACAPILVLVIGGLFLDVMFAIGGGLALSQMLFYAFNLRRVREMENAANRLVYRMPPSNWGASLLTSGRFFYAECDAMTEESAPI